MPRTSQRPKISSFNFRIDADLKEEFTAATVAEDRPGAQVLREFMRSYVERKKREDYLREVRRQSLLIRESPDEEEVMRWIEDVYDSEEWK